MGIILQGDTTGARVLDRSTVRHANPEPQPRCEHLGSRIAGDDYVVRVTCPNCSKQLVTREVTVAVHTCEVNGRCLPNYRCAKTAVSEEIVSGVAAVACAQCEVNPANRRKTNVPQTA